MSADGWTRAGRQMGGKPDGARLQVRRGSTKRMGGQRRWARSSAGSTGRSQLRERSTWRASSVLSWACGSYSSGSSPLGTAEEETAAIAEQLEELSAGDDWLIEVGHPVDRLVAAAADDQVRLLVVGSHGPRSSLLGSVSAELSRRASCPVVVVPPEARVREMPSDRDTGSAGGIARLGLGANGGVDSAGGILRFDLGGGGQ